MKKLIIVTLLISTICKAQIELAEDYSFQKDKVYHVIAGTSISTGMFIWVNNKTNDVDLAFRAAWMSGSFAGLSKEIYDTARGKEMSIADMSYTVFGSLSTAFIMKRITIHRKKKRNKRQRKLEIALSIE